MKHTISSDYSVVRELNNKSPEENNRNHSITYSSKDVSEMINSEKNECKKIVSNIFRAAGAASWQENGA